MAANIAWAKRRVIPWLMLLIVAALVLAGLLTGPAGAVAAGVFAASFYGAITPGLAPVRVTAAVLAAGSLLVLMSVAS